MSFNLFIAVLLGIVAFACKNIGYVFQKKGINQAIKKFDAPAKENLSVFNFLRIPIWIIGIILPFLGALCLIAAYAFGPITLIMPFAGIGFIILILFLKLYLHESISKPEWIALVSILLGIIVITLKVPGITEPAGVVEYYLSEFLNGNVLVLLVGLTIGISIISHIITKYIKFIGGMAYAISAGLIGGISLIVQKPFSFALKQISLTKGNIHITQVLFTGIMFAILAVAAVLLLTRAYYYDRGTRIAPVYVTLQIFIPIAGGAILFRELALFSLADFIILVIGVFFVLTGTAVLSIFGKRMEDKT